MRVLLRTLLLGAIAMTVIPVHALAQPAPATNKTKVKTAKQYVDAGLAAQDSGDYETAITFYTKAYELVPHPVLIFNIAQATRLAGRIEEALALYAKYLAADPNGPQVQTARDRVAEIEAHKAEEARKIEEAREAAEARKVEQARKAEEVRKAEVARKAEKAREAEEARTAQQDRRAHDREAGATGAPPTRAAEPGPGEEPAPGRTLRLSGIAAGGAGVVGLALGIGFGIHARSLSNELSRPGAMFDPSKEAAGNRANTIEVVGLVGGTVLIAAGATLYWWGHTQDRHAEGVALAPMVSNQLAGLAVLGTLP
jgi:tetratricopeptide (TPR) repeat protein